MDRLSLRGWWVYLVCGVVAIGLVLFMDIKAESLVISYEQREPDRIVGLISTDKLEDWISVDELKNFLADDNTNTNPDTFNFAEYTPSKSNDYTALCADYAFSLMNRAAEKGKRLMPVLLVNGSVYSVWINKEIVSGNFSDYVGHIICGARVGELVYLIEPSTDGVILYGAFGRMSK